MKQGIIFDWVGTLAESGEDRAHLIRPEAEEVLALLEKRYKMAVISKTKNPDRRYQEIAQSPLNHYFTSIQTCQEKTEQVIHEALRSLGMQGNQTYALDDRVKNFPLFNQAGCATIWLQQGPYATELPQYPGEAPCKTITSLNELVGLLLI